MASGVHAPGFREKINPEPGYGLQFRLPCDPAMGMLDSPFLTYDRDNSQAFKMAVGNHRHPDNYFIPVLGRAPASRNSGGRAGDLGSIAGRKVTPDDYAEAEREVYIYFWLHYHQWPDRNPNITPQDIQREIYVRLMLIQKAQDLEIHVGDDTVAMAAKEMLSSPGFAQALGLDSQSVPLDVFVKEVLQPEGLTAGRFRAFCPA